MRLFLKPLLTTLASSSTPPAAAKGFSTHLSFRDILPKYDAFILDQFGVMHNGVEALPGALECVKELHAAGKTLIILSNTSAPSDAALKKLPKFGFDPSMFIGAVTSGEEASKYILEKYGSSQNSKASKALFLTWDASDPNNPRLTALPEQFLAECGNVQVAESVEEADFLLLHGSEVWYKASGTAESLGPFIEHGDLSHVNPLLEQCIAHNLPAVCANPDFVVQTPTGGTAFMPGKIAQRYLELGGECNIFGKPQPEHFRACLDALGVDAVAHVGDSLHHDIAGASAAGIDSVFVSSGIHLCDFGDTKWGKLPSAERLQALFEETETTPTHVVPAFCL